MSPCGEVNFAGGKLLVAGLRDAYISMLFPLNKTPFGVIPAVHISPYAKNAEKYATIHSSMNEKNSNILPSIEHPPLPKAFFQGNLIFIILVSSTKKCFASEYVTRS